MEMEWHQGKKVYIDGIRVRSNFLMSTFFYGIQVKDSHDDHERKREIKKNTRQLVPLLCVTYISEINYQNC